jgi:hypothetical protein
MRGIEAQTKAEQHLKTTVTRRLSKGLCILKTGEKEFKGGTWDKALKNLVRSTTPKP